MEDGPAKRTRSMTGNVEKISQPLFGVELISNSEVFKTPSNTPIKTRVKK